MPYVSNNDLFGKFPADTYTSLLEFSSGSTLTTGDGYELTASVNITASNAVTSVTASYSLTSPATTITTASTYQITSSVSTVAISSSYSTFAQNYPAALPTASTQNITSSWTNNIAAGNVIGTVANATTSSYSTFAQNYPAALPTASTQNITSSWSQTSSYAQIEKATFLFTGSTFQITASWSVTSSWSSQSLSSSYSTFAQTFPAALPTGSTQNITSSWANNTNATTLTTASTYQISSSWSINSNSGSVITSSANVTLYLEMSNTGSGVSPVLSNLSLTYNPATGSLFSTIFSGSQVTGSVFGTSSNATSASYSTFAQNYPAALPTASTQNITSSWSVSSSWASQSISASWAPQNVGSGTTLVTASTYQITSSWSNNSLSHSVITSSNNVTLYLDLSNTGSGYTPTLSNLSLTYNPATGSLFSTIFSGSQVTASALFGTASNAVSSAWSPNQGATTLVTGSTFQITASWAVTASFASVSLSSSYSTFAQNYPAALPTASTQNITSSWAVSAVTASTLLNNTTLYSTLTTSSNNAFTASFTGAPTQKVVLAKTASYTITASGVPTTGVSDILLYISHSATNSGTSSLTWPASWICLATSSVWPTQITSSKVFMFWLRAEDTNTIMGA